MDKLETVKLNIDQEYALIEGILKRSATLLESVFNYDVEVKVGKNTWVIFDIILEEEISRVQYDYYSPPEYVTDSLKCSISNAVLVIGEDDYKIDDSSIAKVEDAVLKDLRG